MSGAPAQLIDLSGRPLTSMTTAHYGADKENNELRGWYPPELSGDGELLPELQTLRARTQDLIRNHGLTSGAVQTHLDNIVGPNLRLSLKPNHKALGITPEAAKQWARDTEQKFAAWANDPDAFCDASQRHTFNGLLQMAYRSYLTSFESLATIEWQPNRPGAKFATCIQQIDPARLSNPNGEGDSEVLRAGVNLGPMGEPLAYWIASHMQGDPQQFQTMMTWKRVPRAAPWGRRLVVHVFDGEKPGQTRGKTGIVSIIGTHKMMEKLEKSSLQASVLNAMYAAVVESPVAWDLIGASLGADNSRAKRLDGLDKYMGDRNTWHKDGFIRYNGVKIPHLYPGEELKLQAAKHPTAAFGAFHESFLRHMAGGFNMTYEQFSRDYSKTNYSSARAAMLEAWKFFSGRRKFIAGAIATQYMAAWLEEAMDTGVVETPAGAPDFWDGKQAYCQCNWIGPGRGHIDPMKEEQAIGEAFNNNTTTLEKECAEKGLDWEEVLDQRAAELVRQRELEAEFNIDFDIFTTNRGAGPEKKEQTSTATPETEEEIQDMLDNGEIEEEEAERLREELDDSRPPDDDSKPEEEEDDD